MARTAVPKTLSTGSLMLVRPLSLILALGVFSSPSVRLLAQATPDNTKVYGMSGKSYPTPAHPIRQAQDASAAAVIIDFLKATRLTSWTGMDASGSIMLAGDETPHTAHLSIDGGSSYRLDIETGDGTISHLVSGMREAHIFPGKAAVAFSSDIAFGGLLAFPRILMKGYPLQTSTVLDQGLVTIAEGVSLRRLTFSDETPTDGLGSQSKTVDLFFIPSSHYLSTATTYGRLTPSDPSYYLIETDFDNYTQVSGVVIPMRVSQSINGQIQWSLDLTNVTFGTSGNAASLSF